MTEDSIDFLMCRMFYTNVRHYVRVEFVSSEGVKFDDFLRAAAETFNFNTESFDYFVDQDGYKIDRKDFINVITSDAYRNSFAVGVILQKGALVFISSVSSGKLISEIYFDLLRW